MSTATALATTTVLRAVRHHHHGHIVRFNAVLRTDPTYTTTIRQAFVREVNKRFGVLKAAIRYAVVDADCFGLQPGALALTREQAVASIQRRQFAFRRTADKIDGFKQWLNELEDKGVLEITRRPDMVAGGLEQRWTDTFIRSAYHKGIMRARMELRKQDPALVVPVREEGGAVASVFNMPMHSDRVGALYTRVFSELKGIDQAMDAAISRELAAGLIEGRNPREIARSLNKQVDKIGINRARTLARTEVVRAHHLATVQEYRNAGLEKVIVRAEWSTAGYGVCPICASREGERFTLVEIEGLIPAHPNCLIDGQVKVYSSGGWRPIRDIVVGDLVLTHKGRFRKVVQVHRNLDRPDIVRFKLAGQNTRNTRLSVTAQHPVQVGGGRRWVAA